MTPFNHDKREGGYSVNRFISSLIFSNSVLIRWRRTQQTVQGYTARLRILIVAMYKEKVGIFGKMVGMRVVWPHACLFRMIPWWATDNTPIPWKSSEEPPIRIRNLLLNGPSRYILYICASFPF